MPAAFDMCVSKGGKVRTKNMPGGKYMHICIMNGKSYPGYVKMKKTAKKMMKSASGSKSGRSKKSIRPKY